MLSPYELVRMATVFLVWTSSVSATILIVVDSKIFKSSDASFAPQVKVSGLSGFIAFGNPLDACSSLDSTTGAQVVSSLFLLAMRGNCSFEEKVRHAQVANFAAVIIYNNESGSDLLTMSGSSVGISIPAVFVTHKTGEALAEYADNFSPEVWIVPSLEVSWWSILAFPFLSLVAVGAIVMTCYIVRSYRLGCFGYRYPRHDEHRVMKLRIVQAMPSIDYRLFGNKEAVQESCVICLEEYKNGEQLRILPCSHRFHCSCVDAWLTMWRAVCPVCKQDARCKFLDLQVSEKTPLLSFSGRSKGFYLAKEASSSSKSPSIRNP